MPETKPVALWCVPRSVSTAFERHFVERGDFEVFHEPFSASYYYSPERRSDRFAGSEPKEAYRYEKVLGESLAPREKPAFIKDMAYHVAGFATPEVAARFTNTFLLREPAAVLTSLHKFWPDFTFEEAGFEELHRLYTLAVEAGQEEPAVVDAADLLAEPEGIVAAYCERIRVPHKPEALSWEPGEVPEWRMWSEWHADAQNSTGLQPRSPEPEKPLPKELREVHERCLPYYEELHAKRLRPAPASR
jgi:hypothetical protein